MALTIQQIQDRITAGYDQRDILNLLADYIQANSGGGGAPTPVTYAELVALIGSSGLTAGQQYLVSDFATVHYIVDAAGNKPAGNPIITGTTEPLIVTAVTTNKFDKEAKSTTFPQDVIYIDFDETNWTDDKSFSESGTIVAGWKGTIFFRHDTLLDNYMGYDFRNVKFRRWKTNVAAWDSGTTYAAGNYVTDSGFIYRALKGSNTNNAPADGSDWWIRLLDLTLTEYWCNKPTSTNGITSDAASFDDFRTFAEAVDASYEQCCRSNHFESFKDNATFFDIGATILSNNVFFLNNQGYYLVYDNEIGAANAFNTVAGYYDHNIMGVAWTGNMIDDNSNGCFWGNYCINNIIAKNLSSVVLGNDFSNNRIGSNFNQSTIENGFTANVIGNDFTDNTIGNENTGNTIGNGFKKNEIKNAASVNINFTASTHVYADYNTEIFTRQDGTAKLSYFDNSDVLTIVDANA